MQNRKVFEIRNKLKQDKSTLSGQIPELPALPILPETLLCMELSLCERVLSLSELAEVVLRDPGATIQIMRQAGHEGEALTGSFERIEDCISALGVEVCFDAIAHDAAIQAGQRLEIRHAWGHAREVARNCEQLAQESRGAINPSDAYLVGLLHELDGMPALCGWTAQLEQVEFSPSALARAWSLPRSVQEYWLEQRDPAARTHWSELVRGAHKMQKLQQLTPAPIAHSAEDEPRRFYAM